MKPKDNTETINAAVGKAQELARREGLMRDKSVAHPSDEFAYGLISTEGDMATVGLSAEESETGQEVRKSFPLSELFNCIDAYDIAVFGMPKTRMCRRAAGQ